MITTLQTFEHGRLDYDATVPCIILVQVGFMDSHEFRSWLNHGLKLLIEKKKVHHNILWTVDIRQADVVAQQDIEWAATDWTSSALKEGIAHVAFVRPKDELADMSMTTYQETIQEVTAEGKKMIMANFNDIEEAKEWFRRITV